MPGHVMPIVHDHSADRAVTTSVRRHQRDPRGNNGCEHVADRHLVHRLRLGQGSRAYHGYLAKHPDLCHMYCRIGHPWIADFGCKVCA